MRGQRSVGVGIASSVLLEVGEVLLLVVVSRVGALWGYGNAVSAKVGVSLRRRRRRRVVTRRVVVVVQIGEQLVVLRRLGSFMAGGHRAATVGACHELWIRVHGGGGCQRR